MKKSIYITSVRPKLLTRLLRSVKEQNALPGWNVYLFLQCYTKDEYFDLSNEFKDLISDVILSDVRVEPYVARTSLIAKFQSDIYCIWDDDMVMMPMLNYNTIVDFLRENIHAGMVSGNWVRANTAKMMSRKRYEDKFVNQKIVYTGGGLLFRHDVAQSILSFPIKGYLYDDVQLSLNAYISGYENYRYLGSVIEHNIVSQGGIKTLYKERSMVLLDDTLITLTPCTSIYEHQSNNFYMPQSKDLTPLAHQLHNQNKVTI